MHFVRNMLNEQRKRLVGTVMRHLETQVFPKLTPAEQREVRAKVIGAVGAYHDVCLDLLKSSVDDGATINEEAVRLLARLNSQIQQLREASDGGA